MSHMIFLTVQRAETTLRVHGPENRDYDVGWIVISRVEYGSVLLLAYIISLTERDLLLIA